MDALKKPIIACLVSVVIIILSTGYLFLFKGEAEAVVENPTMPERVDYTEDDHDASYSTLEAFSFLSNQVSFEYTGVRHGEFEVTVGGDVGFAYHTNTTFRFQGEQMFYVPVTISNPSTARHFSSSNWQLYLPNGEEAIGTGGGFDDTLSNALGGARDEIPRNGSRTGNLYFPYVGDGTYRLVFGGDFDDHQHSWRVRGVTVYIELRKD